MRALLAALQCDKGVLSHNLAIHESLIAEAAEHGCDIVVFPEMSLTGSVDPRSHPDDTIAVDDEAVRAVASLTQAHRVAALFGIAERADDACYITQIYVRDGHVDGYYRKRHLGEGEEGFAPGDASALFHLGGTPFGVAICAEGGVDYPFSEPAAAGAPVVFFCAAPGLTGRRTDEGGWRDGFAWWEAGSRGDAVRHARANRIWIALTTQAGSTRDEDFPGLAALISPDGDVVARLPDWRPGTLVVEIPVGASRAQSSSRAE